MECFLKELPRNPTVTLSSVQNKWHTNRKGMRRWMSNNGLSVKEAKKRIRGCNQYVTENPYHLYPKLRIVCSYQRNEPGDKRPL